MNIKKLFICTAAVLMLAGCSNSKADMVDPSTVDADALYLYDVKNGAVKAGAEWSDDGSEGFWMPLSDNVYCEFQNPDVVGAWSPEQYFGSKQLEKGFKNGDVGFGSHFEFMSNDDGEIISIYEINYYENNSVTG